MLAALIALTPTADALSCMYGPGDAFPYDGAAEVPVDVLPRTALYGSATDDFGLALIDEDAGTVVAATVEVSENPGDTHLAWIHPDTLLSPDTTYSVVTLDGGSIENAWRLSTFTTGAASDEAAPEAPSVVSTDRDRGRDTWGSWNWITIAVDSVPASYRVQVATDADFSDAVEVEVVGHEEGSSFALSVGDGLCGGPMSLPTGENHVRVAAVDYAGNVSAFSEHHSAGCSTLSGRGSLAGMLLSVLAVVGLRRRR